MQESMTAPPLKEHVEEVETKTCAEGLEMLLAMQPEEEREARSTLLLFLPVF